MELGEAESAAKGGLLVKEFADLFYNIQYTLHPRGLPGEAQGKSSNLRWAAQCVSTKYRVHEMKRNVIITVVDGKPNFLMSARREASNSYSMDL